MSNYTKSTNFATKDSLPSGNASKIVKGTEIDTEFNNIATAIATKADTTDVALKLNASRFPNVDSNVAASDEELNYLVGVTSLVQTQLDAAKWDTQSWQNVVASRALSTTYTNSTGRPIFVVVSLLQATSSATTIQVTLNGSIVLFGNTATTLNHATAISFLVPAGDTYNVTYAGAAATLDKWAELR